MKKTQAWLFVSLFMVGCTHEVKEPADGPLGSAQDAVCIDNAIEPNAIEPNAIEPNAIEPNAIEPNALTPTTIPTGAMAALQDPGEAGRLSRMLVKYLVSCAFEEGQYFSFTRSINEVEIEENYEGSLALAPGWADEGLSEPEQRWVSACIAARANYYGDSVMISMRGAHSSLGADLTEREDFDVHEGAFWGNIFGSSPALKACYAEGNEAYARDKRRECAAGHMVGTTPVDCANIEIVGECDNNCFDRVFPLGIPDDGYSSCQGVNEVIATYLE